ncbi:MAG: type IV secretory pathway protein AcvB [Shinella sp.]|nr:MAG: type IV secretory pathway protein AcvB [Shinella sp.]
MMKRTSLVAAALLFPCVAFASDPAPLDLGMMPEPHVSQPTGPVKSAVVLLSDAAGWGAKEDGVAAELSQKGALVIGVDFPAYLAKLKADDGDCVYTISDIESVTQQIERNMGVTTYRPPVIAGIGEGGALALAMAAQTPPATVAATVAVDPLAGIPLAKELCTPADKKLEGDRFVYALTEGALPDPVSVIFTKKADAAGRAHAETLKKDWPDVELADSDKEATAALTENLLPLVENPPSVEETLGLPLTILETKPTMDTMAVIVSGDGGWRDIDAEVGAELQKNGVPVVGLDSLHYFWTKLTPAQVGRDLARIITHYRVEFGVKHVMLVGYSFGADVMPDAYDRLPAALKNDVSLISLMAMSGYADYEISVMGIIGASDASDGSAVMDAVAKIDPKKLQCIYGSDEEDDPCPTLADKGVETIRIEGGHHFDEDYPALAQKLIASLKARTGK